MNCVHVHCRWAQFRQIITDIDNNVKELVADRAVKYCAHIGGGYYVSVNLGFYCVDVRKFFMPYNEKEVKPTRKGIALRLNEWARMKTIVETINSTYHRSARPTRATIKMTTTTKSGRWNASSTTHSTVANDDVVGVFRTCELDTITD